MVFSISNLTITTFTVIVIFRNDFSDATSIHLIYIITFILMFNFLSNKYNINTKLFILKYINKITINFLQHKSTKHIGKSFTSKKIM